MARERRHYLPHLQETLLGALRPKLVRRLLSVCEPLVPGVGVDVSVRLEQLLANATPGPWRVVSKHGKANYLPVVADERRLVVMPRAEDATLIALAPDMARLLIDMGDLLTGVLHDLDNGDDPGRGQKQAGRALLARLDALGKDTA